ncbi:hypothetical protein A2318_03175 [Candidatus Uhrbacteria bacterium RIFOXYB2_FULL_45_11]|uniref:Uncharacterized protein n=1 Tax=Candidatus Uhrbacteria bacterium RIFOXYB2_FULL_45_11 TaxID=1802421 RepID=A0A1F7WCB1_9BACT|nr:MAG: hypothetical protein A2318_03175 [Candidatus Uhrbacteria bacterium RIFOXYB2_FULL_45_11]
MNNLENSELTIDQAKCLFPIWKIITLGFYKNPINYLLALKENVTNWAWHIMKGSTYSQTPMEVRLVCITVGELGLIKGGHTKELHAAILAQGGQLCPAEVGPALRLVYKDQPNGEKVWLAMEEALSPGGSTLQIFNLYCDDAGLFLSTGNGYRGYFWSPGDKIVFVAPVQN